MKTYKNFNLKRINLLTSIIVAILLSLTIQAKAQSENENMLMQMIDEDRTTIDAIAVYDQDIQRHILQVAQTPEALNKIEELQERSKSEFRSIIEDYDRDAQSAFYEMARYPSLITDLVSNGLPSSSEVNRIVSNYPDDIRPIAVKNARSYFDVLVRIDQLNNEIDDAFQTYLEPYNSRTRESVNVLLAYPEIVSVLIDNMNFTTQLGEVYSENPEWTERYIKQVSQELAEQSKQDLDAYKNQIQNDPEAYVEMLDASEKFARENNEVRYLNNTDPVVEVRVINSYPFWFGYPYWHSAPYWRPRPIYYHTGFYRNNLGSITFVGLPSFQFMHWHTYNHPTLFPHLSYNYYSYYENHYVNRYRNSHRPVPYRGFYRSIEANVIHNPRVNNSTLQRIDHQRGHNFVRQPNRMESGSVRRGETSNSRRGSEMGSTNNRRGSETINRSRNDQNNSRTIRENSNRNGTEQPNSRRSGNQINRSGNNVSNHGTSGGVGSRRDYNTVNPDKSEGPYNRKGSVTGNGSVRRNATPVTSSHDRTTSVRSRQGNSINRGNKESSRNNKRESSGRSSAREKQSSSPAVSSKGRGSRRDR